MELAGLGSRLIALIIDNIILWVVGAIVGAILGDQNLGFIVSFLIGVVYQIVFLSMLWNGQTIGKKVMGIRVVKKGGGDITPVTAVIRYVGYYVNTILIFLGWIWAIFDGNKQGFHDKMAGTIVVKA